MTVGFGYLNMEDPPGGDAAPVATGPFLTRGKLLDSLAITSGQRLRHVCKACLLDAVPGAADHLASHVLCGDPWCYHTDYPLGACACCGGTFCDKCVRPHMPHGCRKDDDGEVVCEVGVSFAYSLQESVVIETRIGVTATARLGNGRYCSPCQYERMQRVKEQGREIALRTYGPVLRRKSGTGVNPDTWLVFQVPVAKKAGWRRQQAEDDRAWNLAKQYAAELGASISRSLVGCRQREQFHRESKHRSYNARYLLFDERAATPAAAADSGL
jgi:hypothetical protein